MTSSALVILFGYGNTRNHFSQDLTSILSYEERKLNAFLVPLCERGTRSRSCLRETEREFSLLANPLNQGNSPPHKTPLQFSPLRGDNTFPRWLHSLVELWSPYCFNLNQIHKRLHSLSGLWSHQLIPLFVILN